MACIWVLAVLGVITGVTASNSNRIVGGNPTTIENYPSIVQVEFLDTWCNVWSQICAANILTSYYVLSTALCFREPLNPSLRRIRAGTTYRHRGGSLHYVRYAINHPNFGQVGFDADISVIRLWEPLVYSSRIQQTSIPSYGSVIPDNFPVLKAGWGSTSVGGPFSPILRDVMVYTVNNEFCRQRYLELPRQDIVTPNMICAGHLGVGGRDACDGDTGGPLYFNQITIGLISWGHGCANASFPGVSTAVASFTDWIISQAV